MRVPFADEHFPDNQVFEHDNIWFLLNSFALSPTSFAAYENCTVPSDMVVTNKLLPYIALQIAETKCSFRDNSKSSFS
jgi:hypothetical protein